MGGVISLFTTSGVDHVPQYFFSVQGDRQPLWKPPRRHLKAFSVGKGQQYLFQPALNATQVTLEAVYAGTAASTKRHPPFVCIVSPLLGDCSNKCTLLDGLPDLGLTGEDRLNLNMLKPDCFY